MTPRSAALPVALLLLGLCLLAPSGANAQSLGHQGLRGGAGFLQSVSKRISGARSDYYEATAAQRVGRRMLDQLEGAAAAALSSDGVSGRHLLKAGGPNVLPKLAALQKLNLPAAAGAQQAVVPAAGKA